jgi:UDP-N-acetylmuramate dehydrogenase
VADAPADELAAIRDALGELARVDHPIGELTTYRVGGAAAVYVEPDSEAEVARVATAVAATDAEVLVVGNGSNLLVADRGFEGLAVRLGDSFSSIVISGTEVVAGGGALLPVVARRTAAAGLTGFEWAVGVPGSIGGAVRMNAGGHGSEMAGTLRRVRVVDLRTGENRVMEADRLDLAYRHSSVRPHDLVLEATLELEAGDRGAAEAVIGEIVRWRRDNQPGGANAGSVFTNPHGDSAGRLIDAAGAKGLRIGTAEVSPKHANFIQADPGGRAADVLELMAEVRRRVAEDSGIWLVPETRFAGFTPAELAEVGLGGGR